MRLPPQTPAIIRSPYSPPSGGGEKPAPSRPVAPSGGCAGGG
jgi:hypothetical protein